MGGRAAPVVEPELPPVASDVVTAVSSLLVPSPGWVPPWVVASDSLWSPPQPVARRARADAKAQICR